MVSITALGTNRKAGSVIVFDECLLDADDRGSLPPKARPDGRALCRYRSAHLHQPAGRHRDHFASGDYEVVQ